MKSVCLRALLDFLFHLSLGTVVAGSPINHEDFDVPGIQEHLVLSGDSFLPGMEDFRGNPVHYGTRNLLDKSDPLGEERNLAKKGIQGGDKKLIEKDTITLDGEKEKEEEEEEEEEEKEEEEEEEEEENESEEKEMEEEEEEEEVDEGDIDYTEVSNVENIIEGDILLTKEQMQHRRLRKGVDKKYIWPWVNGAPTVPYFIKGENWNTSKVEEAIRYWELHTCIRFERLMSSYTNKPHVKFINGEGCYSQIGRVNDPRGQTCSLGSNCTKLGTCAHEIGHLLGLFHEQSRSDRDQYVDVYQNNIKEDAIPNFESYNTENHGVPYDYSSVFHYSGRAFTANGDMTLLAKDSIYQELLGQRDEPTHRDIMIANIMYGCIDFWKKIYNPSFTCHGEAYIGPSGKCVCPPGTDGDECNVTLHGYYEKMLSPYTEVVTTEGTITSPNFPLKSPKIKMTKKILAPSDQLVKVTFKNVSIPGSPSCRGGFIHIPQHQKSLVRCGDYLNDGSEFVSSSNEMAIYFQAVRAGKSWWEAEVKFLNVTS